MQASPETIAIWKSTRSLGHIPSIFIEEYWVNEPEQCFEIWLYRKGFRPAQDNFLGRTETLDGLDADTFNEYFHDKEHGFQKDCDIGRRGWTWGNVAAFASTIKHIKRKG
tara:strand:+ start:3426 stop:3755 length:330 start_codon:yes stop_codon:yes gene_type:complete